MPIPSCPVGHVGDHEDRRAKVCPWCERAKYTPNPPKKPKGRSVPTADFEAAILAMRRFLAPNHYAPGISDKTRSRIHREALAAMTKLGSMDVDWFVEEAKARGPYELKVGRDYKKGETYTAAEQARLDKLWKDDVKKRYKP